MRGGYQIVDLSTAVVGSETIVKDVYQTIKHFDGKPVFIITPNTSGVFAEFTESSGMYIGAYIGSNSHLFTVSIISSNRVTITDKGPAGGGGTSNYNELSNKPAIAGTTLSGDKSLSDLGIQGVLTEGENITIENNEISANVTASSVQYDNTTSGMTAENVQDAITELNSNKLDNTWTLSKGWAGAGETALTLPEDWTEILIVIKASDSDGTGTNPVLMPKSVIDLLPIQIVSTGIMSTAIANSTCARVILKKINDGYFVNISNFYYAGVEQTNNGFYTRVYYR